MYCSNRSSMATLLQQKNCMKTLSNVSGNTSQQQQTGSKILLPHEMVGLPPVQPISTTSSTTSNTTASSAITSIEHSSINNINQQQQQQQQSQFFHYNSNNYNNINDVNMFRMSATTISSTVSYNNITSCEQNTLMTDDNLINTEDNIDNIINNEYIIEPNVQNIEDEETEAQPEIDIVINNVVCSFSVKCHLNLREIALNGFNVEFRRENGMVTMKLRRPYTTASIWSSGRITCTGATSEDQAKIAARRYARCLQKLGFSAKFNNFRVVNVLGTCSMPWCIRIVNFSEKYKKDASYEPELHPGVTYKIKTPKATLKIFSTGSITVTAASVADVQTAIEHIFPLVYEFRKKRPPPVEKKVTINQQNNISKKRKRPFSKVDNEPTEDIMYVSDPEEEEVIEGSDDDL